MTKKEYKNAAHYLILLRVFPQVRWMQIYWYVAEDWTWKGSAQKLDES